MWHEEGSQALLHHLSHVPLDQAHVLEAGQNLALCQPVHVLQASKLAAISGGTPVFADWT